MKLLLIPQDYIGITDNLNLKIEKNLKYQGDYHFELDGYRICNKDIILGKYKRIEKAKEILKQVVNEYSKGEHSVFVFPEDDK